MRKLAFQIFYNLFTFVLTPIAAVILVSGRRGRSKIWQRFGFWKLPAAEYLWFHGASFGEMSGLIPLLEAARKRQPNLAILVTTTSVSAHERISPYANEVRLLPFDSWIWLRLAFGAARIRALVVTETELWPAAIMFARSRGAAVSWVNAFLSDYAWPRYLRTKYIWRQVISCFRLILAVSQKSAERISKLGGVTPAVKVTGSSKFSLQAQPQPRQKLKNLFLPSCPVVVLGSLRPGEERFWFPLVQKFAKSSKLSFIVAPRHAEKFSYFAQQLSNQAISFVSWSAVQHNLPQSCPVLLLDSMGQLTQLYAQAQLGFVGGTLEDYGGHNPLEAAQAAVPLCIGPFARNVQPVVDELLRSGGAVLVKDMHEIELLLERLIEDPSAFEEMGRHALSVAKQAAQAADLIDSELDRAGIFK